MDHNNNKNNIVALTTTTTTSTKVPILFHIIPMDILSNHILGQYCTGKTISTFAIVLEGYYYNFPNSNDDDDNNNDRKHPPSATPLNNNNNSNKRQRIDNDNNNDNASTIETNEITTSSTVITNDTASNTTTTTALDHIEQQQPSTSILRESLLSRYERILYLIRQRRIKYAKPSSVVSSMNRNDVDNDNSNNNNNNTTTTKTPSHLTGKSDKNDNNDVNANNNSNDDGYVKCEVEKVIEYIQSDIRYKLQQQQQQQTLTNNSTTTQFLSSSSSLNSIKERIKLLSGYCAIIDYFELIPINDDESTTTKTIKKLYFLDSVHYCTSSLIIWVGTMNTSYGKISNGILTCSTTSPNLTTLYNTNCKYQEPYSTWHIAALQYWYNIFDVQKVFFQDTHEIYANELEQMVPYGTLSTIEDYLEVDTCEYYDPAHKTSLDIVLDNRNNNDYHDPYEKFTFVPDYCEFNTDNATIQFDVHPPSNTRPEDHTKLKLYWYNHNPPVAVEAVESYESEQRQQKIIIPSWDDMVRTIFPLCVIRIMERLQHLQPKPYEHFYPSYQTCLDDSDDDPDQVRPKKIRPPGYHEKRKRQRQRRRERDRQKRQEENERKAKQQREEKQQREQQRSGGTATL